FPWPFGPGSSLSESAILRTLLINSVHGKSVEPHHGSVMQTAGSDRIPRPILRIVLNRRSWHRTLTTSNAFARLSVVADDQYENANPDCWAGEAVQSAGGHEVDFTMAIAQLRF